jgi:hypothetical protein
MQRPLRLLFFYLAAPTTLLALLLWLAIEPIPLNSSHRQLSQNDIQRAKQILNTSPQYSQPIRTIELNQDDLNIASNYILNHLISSSTQISLDHESLDFVITLTLPKNLFGPYLNITFKLSKMYGFPVIQNLKIGKIAIANEFAGELIEYVIKHTPLKQYYVLAAQHISNIQINPKHLSITYLTTFQDAAKNASLLENQSYQSLIFYQEQLNQIILKHDPNWRLSLADLMQPLFLSAYQRSTQSNAIEENRALILAVSSYVNKEELSAYLPINLTTVKHYPVYLFKRIDMAKHFVGSAALASTGATTLAHMLGQEKELSDAQRGSGFSFIDLSADRAGLKFGQTATASPQSARHLQKAMHNIKDYRAFMPEVLDLPERMNQRIFRQRYNSVYSPAYQTMLQLIDERIAALPIYQ